MVDLSNNSLTSLSPFSALKELVSFKVGHNKLTELPLEWSELEHMHSHWWHKQHPGPAPRRSQAQLHAHSATPAP